MNLLLPIAALFFAQTPAPAPRTVARVQGTVINTFTGEGLRKATVILRSSDTQKGISYAEEADPNGHFRIDDVQPGEYTVTADRQGYYLRPEGAPGAPAPHLTIAPGKLIDDLLVRMAPTAAISGRVVDQDGDPVRGALVHAMQYVYVSGKRELRQTIQVVTKDKGDYRLFNLRPGRYFIQVTTVSRMQFTVVGPLPQAAPPATTFFPNAPEADSATPVELHAGDDLHGYDVSLRIESTYTIRVKLPAGPETTLTPQLFLRDGSRPARQTIGRPDGNLAFLNVPAGSYVVMLTRHDGASTTYARLDVDVRNADVDAGTADFQAAHDLSGTAKIEGQARAPQNLTIRLQSDGAAFSPAAIAEIKSDGSFTLKGIPPGAYRVALNAGMDNLYLKSIRLGDQLLSDRRIELTKPVTYPLAVLLGADVGEIDGAVKQASGEPFVHARVTLFPDGAIADRGDFFKFTFSDEKGEFHFKGVAPGDYKIFAWEDVLAGQPQDPGFRKRFEKQSTSVNVPSNGHEKLDVVAISVTAARTADR